VQFSTTAFLWSLLDGVVIGGIIAFILVRTRGPLVQAASTQDKRKGRQRKGKRTKEVALPGTSHQARLTDYLAAWAMLTIVVSSASYAVAGGHGAYGIVASAIKAFQGVSDPIRLSLMIVLNLLTFGILGAVLWTGIWWIGMVILRLINRTWAERSRLIHGTIFGFAVGGLLGMSACLTEAMAGRIITPLELLFGA
jgi:hypothetical protein